MIRRWFGAMQFLTVVPVRGEAASPGEAAVFFPLIGALLGASAGAVLLLFSHALGRSIGALLAIAWLVAVTGGLHEDGLADVADAVRAGRSRERMMEILKDSSIGTYGAVALILSLGLRWQALAQTGGNPMAGLAAALALSRASLVALAMVAVPAGAGLGRAFAAACPRPLAIATVLLAAVFAILAGWRRGGVMIAASIAVVLAARWWFTRRLGGVTGDCLGATCQAVEIVNLMILAWQPSF